MNLSNIRSLKQDDTSGAPVQQADEHESYILVLVAPPERNLKPNRKNLFKIHRLHFSHH